MSRLTQLAVNDEGFVFDPATGESYTVNGPGLVILKGLKDEKSAEDISGELCERYEVEAEEAEGDVRAFTDYLRAIAIM